MNSCPGDEPTNHCDSDTLPKHPEISIILPVLDEARQIAFRLQALQPYRSSDCELVLVDGGSTDGTVIMAKGRVDQLLCAPRGRATQMNAGASVARGEWLLFLHIDTSLPTTAIDAIRRAAEQGKIWGRFDVRIKSRHQRLKLVSRMMNLRSRLTGIATGDQAIFVRRDVFQRAGGYPDLPLMEDIALSRRLKRLGRPACLQERVITSGRRWETQGVMKTIWLMWRLRLAYFLGTSPAKLAVRYGYRPR